MQTKDIKTVPNDVARFLGSAVKRLEQDINRLFSLKLDLSRKIDLPREQRQEPEILPSLQRRMEPCQPALPAVKERLSPKEPLYSHHTELNGIAFTNKAEQLGAEIFFQDLQSLNRHNRMQAFAALKKLPVSTAAEMLERLLAREHDPCKIIETLNVLTGLNNEMRIPKRLFLTYAQHDNPLIRSVAFRAISKYRDEEAFAILSAAAKDPDAEVRRQILNCLCWNFEERCLSFALKALSDEDPRVRKTACLILGVFKAMDGISGLITLLSDPDREVQKSANLSLKKITGEDFGFKVSDARKAREDAIEHWRFWWRQRPLTKV